MSSWGECVHLSGPEPPSSMESALTPQPEPYTHFLDPPPGLSLTMVEQGHYVHASFPSLALKLMEKAKTALDVLESSQYSEVDVQ